MAQEIALDKGWTATPLKNGVTVETFPTADSVGIRIFQGEALHSEFDATFAGYREYREDVKAKTGVDLPDHREPPATEEDDRTTLNGNTKGKVVGETAPSAVPASQANPPVKEETKAEGDVGGAVLDGIQIGLDVVGLIPGIGEIADGLNAVVSLPTPRSTRWRQRHGLGRRRE